MIKIITDSTCDIEAPVAKQLNIETVPLRVLFGEQTYRDGIDISKEEFYDKLTHAKQLPTTSQVNPDEFATAFANHTKEGHAVICICISSKLSGTCQSALIAKDMVEGEVYVIDSNSATIGASILVRQAVKMRDAGNTAQEIYEHLCQMAKKVRVVAMVNTLKYLKMGGRISAATAVVGGLLGISPMVAVEEGAVCSIGKVRGQKAAIDFLEHYMAEHQVDTNYPIGFAYSGHSMAAMAEMQQHFHFQDSFHDQLGAVIGTHAGPGAVVVSFIGK